MLGLIFVLLLSIVLTESRLIYRTPPRTNAQQQLITQRIPEILLTATDMIEGVGLIAETHEVTTTDGYILQVHRLPSSKLNPNKVVVLLHGLGSSSDNWMLGRENSLPYYLHGAGYDVWLGSNRGSTYSRRHTKYKLKDERYWDYSMHEIGIYDTAAFIDLALNETGAKKIFLIGHSRGTTTSYILLSSRPEYNDKVKLLISYAPAVYIKHATSAVMRLLVQNLSVRQARKFAEVSGLYSVASLTGKNARAFRILVCLALTAIQRPNSTFINLIFLEEHFVDLSALCSILSHYPDGMSRPEVLHYLQIARSENFRPYDYGSDKKNLERYNTTSPAKYDLSKVRVPLSFYYSPGDNIIGRKDVLKFAIQVPNVVGVFKIANKKFNHLNFVVGKSTYELLYKPTIALMQSYL